MLIYFFIFCQDIVLYLVVKNGYVVIVMYLLFYDFQNVMYNVYNQNVLDVVIEVGKEFVVMCIGDYLW